MLERLFSEGKDWQLHDAEFYKCFIRDCTTEVPAQLLRETADRMREITGLPLTDEVQVTAQRVMPGQSIGVHSDRPLLGYEFARLVGSCLPANPKSWARHWVLSTAPLRRT